MRIYSNDNSLLDFVRMDCVAGRRGRKKWWADQLAVAPMMVSHWISGRRKPSANYLNSIFLLIQQIRADKDKGKWSELLWRSYYGDRDFDPYLLRLIAEQLLVSSGLQARELALISWFFQIKQPPAYELAVLPPAPLWQNRIGWLYESAGLSAGFKPKRLKQPGILLDFAIPFSTEIEAYLAKQQTKLGKKWCLYDFSITELKEELNWRQTNRRNVSALLAS